MKRITCGIKTINWSCCCICGADGSLRSAGEGIKSLADNFLKHWEDDVLDFNPKKITENTVNNKPDFCGSKLSNQAKHHHNCSSKYSEYKRLKKMESLKKKRAKSTQQVDEAGPSLRRSSFLGNPHITYLCTICGINDDISNLCATGAFHATKSTLNINHVIQLTKKWR